MTMTKKREQNLFVCSGKSETDVHLTYCAIEATDRHEASRGLSATAELLVVYCLIVRFHHDHLDASVMIILSQL